MRILTAGDALISLSGHHRQQVWDAAGLRAAPALLMDALVEEIPMEFPSRTRRRRGDVGASWVEIELARDGASLRGESSFRSS